MNTTDLNDTSTVLMWINMNMKYICLCGFACVFTFAQGCRK